MDSSVPQYIGKYRILRELGRGGMGVVYEGENPEVRHPVAIKLLNAQYAQEPQVVARFRTEGIAANLPRHPGIVHVLERGVRDGDNAPYIVMEFVAGESLRKRLSKYKQGLPYKTVIRFGKQIADAIAAAHLQKVIHRDIKPENVIVTQDSAVSGGERTKVLDFGIAMIAPEQLNNSHQDTQINTAPADGIIGTVFYMAPEQWQADADKPLDDRADVYQLGAMLYELLTGKPPFVAKEAFSIGYMHVNQEPAPLSQKKEGIHPDLSALVLRMLAKSSTQRPSMKQVAAALEQLEQSLTGASSQMIPVIQGALPRPNRWVVLVLSVLVLVAAALLLRELWPASRYVTWRISSVPPGAMITGADGSPLGKTPWNGKRRRDIGKAMLKLQLPGYRLETLKLDNNVDEERTVTMEKAAP